MAFGLFYEGFFWDNLAHFLTSFALVSLAAEVAAGRGALPFPVSARRALAAGALAGLAGGGAWEVVEMVANFFFPALIYNPLPDTALDTVFGTLGGAAGAWRTAAYLHLRALRS